MVVFREGTAPGAATSAGDHNFYFDSADSLLKSHENGGSAVAYYSTANPQTALAVGGLTGSMSSAVWQSRANDETGNGGGTGLWVFNANPTLAGVTVSGGALSASGATATSPNKTGTSLPGTCTVGESFQKTDATASSQYYLCTATNTWTAQGGGGSSTTRYTFQGTTQAGQNAWNMNYAALTNMTWSTVDATNITPMLVVTANTSGSALRSVTPVTSTNPTITFQATVRSTDATNSGSIALAYACVPSGDSVNNPSFTSLTALSLTTIDADSETFESSQAVTCTGTAASPARLYVTWTPTAPSGGTLSLISFGMVY